MAPTTRDSSVSGAEGSPNELVPLTAKVGVPGTWKLTPCATSASIRAFASLEVRQASHTGGPLAPAPPHAARAKMNAAMETAGEVRFMAPDSTAPPAGRGASEREPERRQRSVRARARITRPVGALLAAGGDEPGELGPELHVALAPHHHPARHEGEHPEDAIAAEAGPAHLEPAAEIGRDVAGQERVVRAEAEREEANAVAHEHIGGEVGQEVARVEERVGSAATGGRINPTRG